MTEVAFARGDVTLRGTVTGSGPAVLLLHAGGERRGVWKPITARLAGQGMRTVAFDLRGHGDSTGPVTRLQDVADDVTAMISREPSPVVVVGSSLGGLAAVAALADPDTARRVAGLVLVDVVPDPDPTRSLAWLDDRGLARDHAELIEDVFRQSPQLSAASARLELPILLVRGGSSSPLSDTDVERFRKANPDATVTCLAAAGHLVARDAPEDLGRIIADHASAWLTG